MSAQLSEDQTRDLFDEEKLLVEEADRRGIPVALSAKDPLTLLVGGGPKPIRSRYGAFSRNGSATIAITRLKQATKEVMKAGGANVLDGATFFRTEAEKALDYAKFLGFPVVVKPDAGIKGKGVTSNIMDAETFVAAFHNVPTAFDLILVEKHFAAPDYRVLVVGGEVFASVNRIPANVTGDGRNSIAELIKAKNDLRATMRAHPPILVGFEVGRTLEAKGHVLTDVLEEGQYLEVRSNANLSTGGECLDFTDDLHPDYKRLIAHAAQQFRGLFIAGFDVFMKDPYGPATADNWAINEINCGPLWSLHHFPWQGQARNVAGRMLDLCFPNTAAYGEGASRELG